MKIARESWVIAALGIADLVTTIIFIEHHGAEEANPLFRYLWDMGIGAFIMAKLILLACPLLVLEWARKRNPRFTIRALRGAIAGYILLYGIGFARLNGPVAQAGEIYALNSVEAVQYAVPNQDSAGLGTPQVAAMPRPEAVLSEHPRTERWRRTARQRWIPYRDTGRLAGLRVPHVLPVAMHLRHRFR